MTLDFSRSAPACAGPVNIARSTAIAACYVALKHLFRDVPANAGVPRADPLRHPRDSILSRQGAEAGRRLHRDDPARHRRRSSRRWRRPHPSASTAAPTARSTRCRSPATAGRAALGDVLLLRRRPWRPSGGRRPQPRQRADLDRDHPAARDPRGGLSGDVHALGAARRTAAAPGATAAGWARSTRSSCSRSRPTCSCSASAASFRRPACSAAARGALTRSAIPSGGDGRQPPMVSKMVGIPLERGERVRLETPGGGGYGDAGERAARARRALGDDLRGGGYGDAPTARSTKRYGRAAPQGRRMTAARRRASSSASMSAAPSPTCSSRRGERHVPHRQGAVDARRPVAGLPRRHRRGRARDGPRLRRAAIVHGTTVGTNALLERKGARTGIITTAGFRDVLEMRRRDRPQTWGLWGEFVPVVPRDLRLEVAERTLADGTVRTAVDPAEVRRPQRRRCSRAAPRRSPSFFINAYANPANERAALAALRAVWPNALRHRVQRDPAGDPRVRALLDHDAQRLSAAGGRVATSRRSTAPARAPASAASC